MQTTTRSPGCSPASRSPWDSRRVRSASCRPVHESPSKNNLDAPPSRCDTDSESRCKLAPVGMVTRSVRIQLSSGQGQTFGAAPRRSRRKRPTPPTTVAAPPSPFQRSGARSRPLAAAAPATTGSDAPSGDRMSNANATTSRAMTARARPRRWAVDRPLDAATGVICRPVAAGGCPAASTGDAPDAPDVAAPGSPASPLTGGGATPPDGDEPDAKAGGGAPAPGPAPVPNAGAEPPMLPADVTSSAPSSGCLNTTRSTDPGSTTTASRASVTSVLTSAKTTWASFSFPGTQALASYAGTGDQAPLYALVKRWVALHATTVTCGGGSPSIVRVSAPTRSVGPRSNARPATACAEAGAAPAGVAPAPVFEPCTSRSSDATSGGTGGAGAGSPALAAFHQAVTSGSCAWTCAGQSSSTAHVVDAARDMSAARRRTDRVIAPPPGSRRRSGRWRSRRLPGTTPRPRCPRARRVARRWR